MPSPHETKDGWILSKSHGKKISLLLILILTTIIVVDSTILKLSTYSDVELPTSSNIAIFVTFCAVFIIIGFILINSIRKNLLVSGHILPRGTRYFQELMFGTQILISGILVMILVQITFLHKYNVLSLHPSTILSHLSALIFLILLIAMFISWIRSKRNSLVLLYIISFSFVSLSVLLSLIYLEYQFNIQHTYSVDRRPFPFFSYLAGQIASPFGEALNTAFDIVYLLSFFSCWLATSKLLYQYRYKLGKIKYFVLISIPLIYYLLTFEIYFGNLFSSFALNYPLTFGVTYTIIFSGTKQIGALFFSLAFWTASSLVVNERVRKSLLISAIGIAILFGSIEITTLQYRLYPPFGLVTQAFMPLGAYLLLVGIFTSASSVARDAKLRKEFYKSAMSQFNLLKTIGVTQMEKELLKEYKPVLARSTELKETEYQPLEQSDVKEIIHDVLQELQAREKQVSKNGSKS